MFTNIVHIGKGVVYRGPIRSYIIDEIVLFKKAFDPMGDQFVSELWHGWKKMVLYLKV